MSVPPAAETVLASEVLEEWGVALSNEGLSAATLTAERRHVTEFLGDLAAALDCPLPALPLHACTRRALRAHLQSYQQRPDRRFADAAAAPAVRSPASVRARRSALRSFIRWCEEEELLTGVSSALAPTRTRRESSPEPSRPQPLPLTLAEARSVLAAAATGRRGVRDRALIACTLELGLAVSEVARLAWSDVDISAGTLTVSGKTRRSGERPPRVVVLTPHAREVLTAYLEFRERSLSRRGVGAEELILCGSGGLPQRTRALARACERVLQRAGLAEERCHSHLLRASYARLAWEAGALPRDLADVLGLRDLGSVARLVATPTRPRTGLPSHPLASG